MVAQMTLTIDQLRVVVRALRLGIESRESDAHSFRVLLKRDPQFGRIIRGKEDITDQVHRDLVDFSRLLKRITGCGRKRRVRVCECGHDEKQHVAFVGCLGLLDGVNDCDCKEFTTSSPSKKISLLSHVHSVVAVDRRVNCGRSNSSTNTGNGLQRKQGSGKAVEGKAKRVIKHRKTRGAGKRRRRS